MTYTGWDQLKTLTREMPIWSTILEEFASGTGTAETAAQTVTAPSRALQLVGWSPWEEADAPGEKESVFPLFRLKGGNWTFGPQEVYGQIHGGSLASAATNGTKSCLGKVGPKPFYEVYAPVTGNSDYDLTLEPLDALAGDGRAGATFFWSNRPPTRPVVKSQADVEVINKTAGRKAATTSFTPSSAHTLVEYGGGNTNSTPTVDEEVTNQLEIQSDDMEPVSTVTTYLESISAMEIAGDSTPTLLTRVPCNLSFTKINPKVTATFILDQATTVEATMGWMIRYT